MNFFVASRGQSTIGVAPAGRAGLFSRIHHGDGFSIKKPRHKAGVSREPMSGSYQGGPMKGLIGTTRQVTVLWAIRIINGAIYLQIVVSIAVLGITPGAAMAVSEQSLRVQADLISELEARLRPLDSRTEKLAT